VQVVLSSAFSQFRGRPSARVDRGTSRACASAIFRGGCGSSNRFSTRLDYNDGAAGGGKVTIAQKVFFFKLPVPTGNEQLEEVFKRDKRWLKRFGSGVRSRRRQGFQCRVRVLLGLVGGVSQFVIVASVRRET